MKLKQTLLSLCGIAMLWALTTNLNAQVTIGSTEKPNAGALLDLKDGGTYINGETAKKGLGLPRVELQAYDKLKMGAAAADLTAQSAEHMGLVVYNISGNPLPQCAPIPDGLYVWDGAKWNGLNVAKAVSATLDVGSKTIFDLPSGRDSRPLTAQNFTATWSPSNPLPYTNIAHATLDGISFAGTPLTISPLSSSPAIFSMTPDAMTIIPATPWQSKESILTFDTTDECDGTVSKTITLNQTNYALKVNNQFSNSQIIYAVGNTFAVEGNATWTTTTTDPLNVLASLTPTIGGSDINDYPNTSLNNTSFQYITNASSKYYTGDITFKDTESQKRFDDITVSILNCNTAIKDLTLEQWAERAGFTTDQIATVTTTTPSVINATNGVQLHRDQNNNLFLSGDFGTTAGRWMLNNLAATKYAKAHLHGRALTGPSYTNAFDFAYWTYPNVSKATYDNNPRMGLLYNWDAATGGKGGSTGENNINDGENVTTSHARIQGACPNGWHLPSDYEWTELEWELNDKTSNYSSIPNAGGTITKGVAGARGSTHGQAMKDPCPVSGQTLTQNSGGASNILSGTSTNGFNVMLVGWSTLSASTQYGAATVFWTSSGAPIDAQGQTAWYRVFYSSQHNVVRNKPARVNFFSVRCKKD